MKSYKIAAVPGDGLGSVPGDLPASDEKSGQLLPRPDIATYPGNASQTCRLLEDDARTRTELLPSARKSRRREGQELKASAATLLV